MIGYQYKVKIRERENGEEVSSGKMNGGDCYYYYLQWPLLTHLWFNPDPTFSINGF